MVQRVYERQTRAYSETGIFRVLVQLAPEELARPEWKDHKDKWLPDSRLALAGALGEARLEGGSHKSALSLLQSLMADGQYKVRRAAYRGLAGRSMDDLYKLCLSWSEAAPVELRQRAAEAYAWLDEVSDENGVDALTALRRDLSVDPEEIVRETADRSWQERRNRDWAEQYLSIVRGVKGETNQEILDAWCYGDALARIGDDSCLKNLRDYLNEESHPPHLRYWLQRTLEKMEKNWRKTTQKWPEPWFAWEGEIVEGQGQVQGSRGRMIPVNYSIWAKSAATFSKPSSWGGACWPIPFPFDEEGIVELEDGRKGKIVIVHISKGIAVFMGNGPYPGKE